MIFKLLPSRLVPRMKDSSITSNPSVCHNGYMIATVVFYMFRAPTWEVWGARASRGISVTRTSPVVTCVVLQRIRSIKILFSPWLFYNVPTYAATPRCFKTVPGRFGEATGGIDRRKGKETYVSTDT